MIYVAAVLHRLLGSTSEATQPYRPELRIAESNGNVTLSWPRAAYYYALVANTNLGGTNLWPLVATASADFYQPFNFHYPFFLSPSAQITTNFLDEEITFTLPATGDQAFYGLEGPRAIPVCQFAVFYDGLLEFSTAAPMTIHGPVHANGDIYTGTSTSLIFNRPVTTTGTISSPAWNGQGPTWADTGTFNSHPSFVTNVPPLTVLAGQALTNLHRMIEMPPSFEDPASPSGWSRYYNQAQVVVLVSNTTISARIQAASALNNPGSDPSPILIWTNLGPAANLKFPFLRTNSFFDARESKSVKVTEIDLGLFKGWLSTNVPVLAKFPPGSGLYPTILYIADNRTNSSSTMSAIRITNGVVTPYNGGLGFTLVTPNPLYVWGHYNNTNAAYLGTTNTSATVPSALICDALTILSSAWRDSASAGSLSGRIASSVDTINAAIITGNVPSTGSSSSQFSGGIHNLPRLLENWASSTLWLNTSLVCFYQSTVATNRFQNPGVYYNAPTRKFSFDPNFNNLAKLPPGTPVVGVPAPGN